MRLRSRLIFQSKMFRCKLKRLFVFEASNDSQTGDSVPPPFPRVGKRPVSPVLRPLRVRARETVLRF